MKMKRKRVSIKNMFFITLILILFFTAGVSISYVLSKNKISNSTEAAESLKEQTKPSNSVTVEPQKPQDEKIDIILSSAGDCTIGTDPNFNISSSLPAVVRNNNNDYSYLFKNVSQIFKEDDITIVNLETTFTNAEERADKKFTFKAPPEFAQSLNLGHIEGVNISNNHTHDFLEKGFTDTINTLQQCKINYFGEGNKWVTEVKGVKFGFLGYQGWSANKALFNNIKKDVQELKAQNCVVVINFHWGIEGQYNPNNEQKQIAHFAIDNGADLIIGHHPHVIQGIEKYKEKYICYSLGNFCFGGNSNPPDKDTFVFQEKFSFTNKSLTNSTIRVVPFSVSSVNYKNDYCPTPLKGEAKDKLLEKLNKLSSNLGFKVDEEFK